VKNKENSPDNKETKVPGKKYPATAFEKSRKNPMYTPVP
jgi:hypothetical protein